jgi:hypothetical protein
MTTRPMLTQREAAAACGVSRTTIRRRREGGDLPGAVRDPARGWLIPVDDLLAAGFRLNAPTPPDYRTVVGSVGDTADEGQDDVAVLRAELERVRHEHALALTRAEHAAVLARAEADHLRAQLTAKGEHITDLQRALAALMPAPKRSAIAPMAQAAVPGQSQAGPEPASEVPEREQPSSERLRGRWWWRR